MSVLSDMASKHGIDAIVLLSCEELREIKAKAHKQATNLPHYLIGEMKSLQFYLKNLQKKDCSHSMIVLTIRPSTSKILEILRRKRLLCSKLVMEGALDLSNKLHENSVQNTFLAMSPTGNLPRRRKATMSHLSSLPLFIKRRINFLLT